MRITILALIATMFAGCSATYKQSNLTEPTGKLLKGKSVVITTPSNGSYGNREYSESGKMTALAVRAAFARFSDNTTVSTDCKDLECLKKKDSSKFDYYVIAEILHWEDRATEWSGKPDRIEVKLSIHEGKSWRELASTIISGKSKWATFGGDHPQDLLPEPLNNYVASLY